MSSRASDEAVGVLVIGYGSDLHGDDAVGRRAAETVAKWRLPGVEALSVPQLTPELAERIAEADLVVFIDAAVEREGVAVSPLRPGGQPGETGHRGDPARLLSLAAALYARAPQAWLVSVGAADLELGEQLSPTGERGLQTALDRVRALCSHPLTPA
jgi:hydrogenase maturation protease